MTDLPVVVVGGGLAGLACAGALTRQRVPVQVLEAGDQVGGRIRTDVVDGFTIDRGFQVLNTAYPALRRSADVDALDLRLLPRGIRVRRDGRLHDIPHPFSSPAASLHAANSGIVGLRGKVALARYAAPLVAGRTGAIKRRDDVAASEAWRRVLPEDVVDHVLTPFFRGVVLEQHPTTSRVFTDLMMRMFALGAPAVPAAGMQALPRALADRLPRDTVRLGAPVDRIGPTEVALSDGTVVAARAVVVATDPWTAYRLIPELGLPPVPRQVTTHYFATTRWRGIDGTLAVDADGSDVVNSVVLTESAPEYAVDGRALIATSVLAGPDRSVDEVRRAAAALHDAPDDDWELVCTRHVPQALPAMPAPHPLRKPVYLPGAGVWVAGDHRDTSSIQGALVSGERAAASVLRLAEGSAPVRAGRHRAG